MMKLIKNAVYLSLTICVVSGSISRHAFANAESLKVGVVDMQKALQTVDAGKKAKKDLEEDFNKRKKDLQAEESAIKKLHEDFQKQSLVMNEQTRGKKQSEIQERIMKLQEATAKNQMEIQKREQQLTEPIISKLKSLVKSVAEKKGYTIVLERNENMVLYSMEKDDLTADVITAYGK